MVKASDNAFPSLLITEGTEPSAPAAGKQRLYIDSTSHHLMRTNSSGTETDIEAGSSGGLTELDYVQFTSPVTISATTEAGANTIVTGSAVAYSGSQVVMIEFFCPALQTADATDAIVRLWLYDGSSSIGRLATLVNSSPDGTIGTIAPCFAVRRLTPSAATHTYSIRGERAVGDGTANAGAGGSGNIMPGYIRIVEV